MNSSNLVDLESLVVEKLWGRISLLQSQAEKEQAIASILSEAQGNDQKQRLQKELKDISGDQAKIEFIKGFLSYGVIEDLLCDSEVEDIIINSLKDIYIHHSQDFQTYLIK